MRHIVIVLPTYNERENIGVIIPAIFKVTNSAFPECTVSVLVVDDSSPDDTAGRVRELQNTFPNIHLIVGKRAGLGRAYIRGIKYAITLLGADIVVEMDADLSHDPKALPSLIQKVLDGSADFVIGSRYVAGGSVPSYWPKLRKLNSICGNFVARLIIGLYKVNDCTSGYRAISTRVLQAAVLDDIPVAGYAFQVSLLQRAMLVGARILEVPIAFQERTAGSSKLRFADIWEFVTKSFLLRLHSIQVHYGVYLLFAGFFTLVTGLLIVSNSPAVTFVTIVSVLLFIQGIWNLKLILHAWDDPYRMNDDDDNNNGSATDYEAPQLSFTALLPARHEEAVIEQTIRAIDAVAYPKNLKRLLVIVRFDDEGTIELVRRVLGELGDANAQLVITEGFPINKPKSLNEGLARSSTDMVVPFDAEDEPHPDLYNIVNTTVLRDKADVVQCGVQLMNFESNWYSMYNVLEYFFWFKSILPYFAKHGAVPLGGNSVFFKRSWLTRVDGWNENCLTEDAEVGMKLSQAGANIRVIYHELHATREETPPTLGAFIRQRTRWHQGFMQIVRAGQWRKFLTLKQQLLSMYILVWPEVQALLFLYAFGSVIVIYFMKLPVWVTLLSLLPLYLLVVLFVISAAGMYQFCKSYSKRFSWLYILKMLVAFYPFQIVLGFAAVRAVWRILLGNKAWEKTAHIGAHRPSLKAVQVPIE